MIKELLSTIISAIYFMLPAYAANMAPVFARKIPFLNIPIDLNLRISDKPIFGKNKTYRGFFFGIIASITIILIQKQLSSTLYFKSISLIEYSIIPSIKLGFLMGFGALFGDLIKSFFKRRINIPPGKSWPFFDQSDFIIGTLLFTSTIYLPSLKTTIIIFITSIILQIIAVDFAYKIRLR